MDYSVWFSTELKLWTWDNGTIQGETSVSGEVKTVSVTLSGNLLAKPKQFIQIRAD